MLVARTSFRLPSGGRASAARCAAGSMPPWSLCRSTSAGSVPSAPRSARSRRLRAGMRGTSLHGLGQRKADRCGHLRLDARRGVAPGIIDVERERSAFANDCRRIIEKRAEPASIECRRHRNQAKIGPKRFRRVERERQREVVVEAAFMDLVEQDRGNARQLRISLDPRQEHAMGHGDHARRFADLAVEPRRIADRLPRLLPERRGHELGGRPRGEPSRHEQQHLSAAPIFRKQRRRDLGRLSAHPAVRSGALESPPERRQQVGHTASIGRFMRESSQSSGSNTRGARWRARKASGFEK